jgi:prepilin-type N-terminal cleavage/methylation domain-containing protein
MHTPANARHAGFTLVEIAIVLVIIGLLLGGVLKGQSMIESARVRALASELQGTVAMLYAYQDKFKALPGDDSAAVAHQSAATQATATTAGNGRIDTGTWVGAEAVEQANESSVFWQHVRLAGLASGAATSGQALNAVGGRLGVTSNSLRVNTPANVAGSLVACSSGLNGKLAKQLDYALDDGVATTGSLFAAAETAGPVVTAAPAEAYADNSTYTVCLAF